MKRLLASAVLAICILCGTMVLSPSPARAISLAPVTQFAACDPGNFFTFPTWYACLPKDADGHPKLTKLEDVWLIAFPVLESAIKAAAYVAVVLMLYGGIRMIKSQGNPANIAGARDTMRDAAIGLIICVSAVAIVQFLASRI